MFGIFLYFEGTRGPKHKECEGPGAPWTGGFSGEILYVYGLFRGLIKECNCNCNLQTLKFPKTKNVFLVIILGIAGRTFLFWGPHRLVIGGGDMNDTSLTGTSARDIGALAELGIEELKGSLRQGSFHDAGVSRTLHLQRESSGGMEWLGVWNCIFSASEISNFGA